ncbi:MAG: alpha/beta hydrolase [Saprospiraceae bacterium]|nr:alpha/beta hydrolase [Saprospiraceae bacterium]
MMNDFFTTKDGLRLYTLYHKTANPAATILFIHGYTEHSGRYDWLAQQFNERGIDFLTYDQRGFGRSEGVRAYVNSFDLYLEDLEKFIAHARIESGPVFLMGQSMGALIGILYLIKSQDTRIRGMISTSGALKISEHISPFLRKISGFMSKVAPWLPTIKLDARALSRDKVVVDDYLHDPMVYHGGTKARMGHEMLMAMKKVQMQAPAFVHPILLLHGTADRLADVEGSKMFYQHCNSADKKLLLYEGWYHELFREEGKQQIAGAIIQWITEHST